MIVALSEKGGAEAKLGEKAYLLGAAKRSGLPVPDGFVIDASSVATLYDERLAARLLKASAAKVPDVKLVNSLLKQLTSSIDFPPSFLKAVRVACSKIPGATVLRLSHAGSPMHELPAHRTVMPIATIPELTDGIRTILGSYLQARARTGAITPPALLVQQLIEADVAGIASSFDPLTHDDEAMVIEAALGLGSPVVAGAITPDRYKVAKGTLKVIDQTVATQSWKLVANHAGKLAHRRVEGAHRSEPKLSPEDLLSLARLISEACALIRAPVELEWVKAGEEFSIVDLRVVSRSTRVGSPNLRAVSSAVLGRPANVTVRGIGASAGVVSGIVKVIHRITELEKLAPGQILVTELTSPAFVPAFSKAAAVVTDTGGVNSHAAVAAREMGIPCIVAAKTATHTLKDGQVVTVDGSEGLVYPGVVPAEAVTKDYGRSSWAKELGRAMEPITATKLYVNLTDPTVAQAAAQLAVDGVGLLRAEFMIAALGEHPQALLAKGKRAEMVAALSERLATVARAFAPRPVVYRLSDFKTSEYRNLKGGEAYEPKEENPALGFRGARRLIDQPAWLETELEMVRITREQMGHRNIWLMIPFVRVPEELAILRDRIHAAGLYQGADFKLWMMVEVPSNVILIRNFIAQGIDGISIGTNDLTSLIFGVDRDAGRLASLYPPTHPAVLEALVHVVSVAKHYAISSSICGQAASAYPEVVEALVRAGITSVSVSPDAVVQTRHLLASVERQVILDTLLHS
ncbi:MAG: putative PEP-binding protein [Patescibacteria group bacterium]